MKGSQSTQLPSDVRQSADTWVPLSPINSLALKIITIRKPEFKEYLLQDQIFMERRKLSESLVDDETINSVYTEARILFEDYPLQYT